MGNALTGNSELGHRFLGGTDGIASQLDSLINGYTQPGGLLDTINKGLQSSLSDVANQQTALNARLATYSATLTKEYNAMDTAVALLKQTQTYLTAEFNPNSGTAQLVEQQRSSSSGTLKHRRRNHDVRQNRAAQYRAVRSHGQVADASPTRLVQIMFEHILSHLATARRRMGRIEDNRPLAQVLVKVSAMGKAIALIGQLNATLDMERGGQVAANLRALYEYMLDRLTLANATNMRRHRGRGRRLGRRDQERLGPNRHGSPMTRNARQALERAFVLSQQLLDAADQSNVPELARLDAERFRLLQSVRLERDNLTAGDRLAAGRSDRIERSGDSV